MPKGRVTSNTGRYRLHRLCVKTRSQRVCMSTVHRTVPQRRRWCRQQFFGKYSSEIWHFWM